MTSEAKILTENNIEEVVEWCGGRAVVQHDALDYRIKRPAVNVPVGDSAKRAQIGDAVIRNSDGTFQVFRKDS